ncbi:hypothetical protein J3Q64DRAFT_1697998 [Phycomyces blakesleeanus]|uniref:Uncharacterized protein n=1 Tax=Phycomyces blakesleeanus TaxID=4837 RepID=A0ABR3B4V2_PHYBL
MPLIVFGNGLTNKSSVRFHSLWHGVSEKKNYSHLLVKQKIGELYFLDINELNTSKVFTHFFFEVVFVMFNVDFVGSQLLYHGGKNIFYIVQEIWSGNGRPEMFNPQPSSRTTRTTETQSATMNVVSPHSGGRT